MLVLGEAQLKMSEVVLRVKHDVGCYGGAAFEEPIKFICVPGQMPLGDWSICDGLKSYSGGAKYSKAVRFTQAQLEKEIHLDLGQVTASAEVIINGFSAGILIAPPWKINITSYLKPGDNQIDVLVYNTLANHYLTIPTRYRGNITSGLLGPAKIQIMI
jgi:hypothetical protein